MIRETNDGCLLDVEVKSNSDTFSIGDIDPWQSRLKVHIKSLPINGRANRELLKEMKSLTGAEVDIAKGEKSTKKTLLIRTTKRELKKQLNI